MIFRSALAEDQIIARLGRLRVERHVSRARSQDAQQGDEQVDRPLHAYGHELRRPGAPLLQQQGQTRGTAVQFRVGELFVLVDDGYSRRISHYLRSEQRGNSWQNVTTQRIFHGPPGPLICRFFTEFF